MISADDDDADIHLQHNTTQRDGGFYLHETVGDKVLVFEPDARILHQPHHRYVIDQNITSMGGTRYRLAEPLLDDLGGQVLLPALRTETVSAFQTGHHL